MVVGATSWMLLNFDRTFSMFSRFTIYLNNNNLEKRKSIKNSTVIYNLSMIQNSTFKFLEKLRENNNSEWFKANNEAYREARADVISFVSEIILGLSIIDKDIQSQYLVPHKCIKRINRDIRFSLDKTPYKSHFFVLFNPGGYKSEAASYYLQIEPGKSFVGGGVYMPPTAVLNQFRKEIEYNLAEWEEIVKAPTFLKLFPNGVEASSSLKTVPRGFDIQSEAIEYLRMKGFHTASSLSNKELTSPNAVATVLNAYKEMQPMVRFLNAVM